MVTNVYCKFKPKVNALTVPEKSNCYCLFCSGNYVDGQFYHRQRCKERKSSTDHLERIEEYMNDFDPLEQIYDNIKKR